MTPEKNKKPTNQKKPQNQWKRKQRQKIKPNTGRCFLSINIKKLLHRIWCQETLSQGTMIKQNYLYLFITPNFGKLFCRFLFVFNYLDNLSLWLVTSYAETFLQEVSKIAR